MEEEPLEKRLRRIERNHKIAAIAWAIVAAIGFAMVIIGSSPAWFGPLGEMTGTIGAIGTWFTILDNRNQRNQERTLRNQERTLRNQERMIEILQEIRGSLTSPTKLKREE